MLESVYDHQWRSKKSKLKLTSGKEIYIYNIIDLASVLYITRMVGLCEVSCSCVWVYMYISSEVKEN